MGIYLTTFIKTLLKLSQMSFYVKCYKICDFDKERDQVLNEMTTNTADRWTILAKSIFSLRLDFTNKRKPKLMKWKGENKSELMQKGQRKSKEPKHINCYPQTAQTNKTAIPKRHKLYLFPLLRH